MLTFLKKFLSLRPKTIPEKPEAPYKVEVLPAGTEAAIITAANTVVVVADAVVPAAVVEKAPAKPKAKPKPKAPAKPKAEPKPRTPKAAAK